MRKREILVVRQKDRFSSILIEHGFAVTNFPVIKTEALSDLSELENLLAQSVSFDGIFLTSINAAEVVLAKLNETDKTFRGKFYVLGKRSDDLLTKNGYETFFSENATSAEELLEIIPENELKGKKFLFARGNRSLRIIPEKLKNVAEVWETIVYKTLAAEISGEQSDNIKKKLENENFEAVCFFSPSSVEGFLENVGNFIQGDTTVAAIGNTTARFAESNNLRIDFVASKPIADDFAFELIDYLKVKRK